MGGEDMWTEQEKRNLQGEVRGIKHTVEDLDDVVRGNDRQGMPGMVGKMKKMEDFMEKWERREYAGRLFLALVTGNFLLTIIGILTGIYLG